MRSLNQLVILATCRQFGRSFDLKFAHDQRGASNSSKLNAMEAGYLSAVAALAGSAVGGLTSFCASWLGQSSQLKTQMLLQDKSRREEVYRDYVCEASKSYIDALTSDKPDLSKLFTLYALICRMRILSSSKVINEAEKVARLIVESYPQPNRTFSDVRAMIQKHTLDPLRDFSEACREELRGS